jgi:hypothetical protein
MTSAHRQVSASLSHDAAPQESRVNGGGSSIQGELEWPILGHGERVQLEL